RRGDQHQPRSEHTDRSARAERRLRRDPPAEGHEHDEHGHHLEAGRDHGDMDTSPTAPVGDIGLGRGGRDRLTLPMAARPATADDVSEVLRLAAVMYASMGQDPTDPRWVETATTQFISRLGDDLGVFVVDHPDHEGLAASAAVTITTRLSGPTNMD